MSLEKKICSFEFLNYRSSPPANQSDVSLTDTPEYLSQLLKDRRQLAAIPNMFFHAERLLDQGKFLIIYK